MKLVTLAVGFFAPFTWAASAPLPPSQDPFYRAPPNFEKHSPGTILRIRPAPGNFSLTIANCSAAYHILYRTTDTRYRPSYAITTLLLPLSYSPSSPKPLLSYQIPYNSVDIDASPSYENTAMAAPNGAVTSSLGRGWLVVVPDFEGPLASYGAGVQAGHATIDSLRAILSLQNPPGPKGKKTKKDEPHIGTITRYAMWGYSGGAIATVFAAELATQYATELSFAGAAIGGVVPNMTVVIHNINSSPFTGNIPAGLVGVTNQYEDASAFLLSSLKESGPYNRTGFFKVKEYTILESWAAFAGQDIFEYFVNGIGVMYAPVMLKVLRSNTVMGYHGTPQMPMFVHQGVRDKFSDISLTDALVERYCGIGVRVRYERNSVGGHIAEITNGPPRVQAWLAGVLEGTGEVEEGCDVRNVTVAIVDVPDF